jgi:hypothetical protein
MDEENKLLDALKPFLDQQEKERDIQHEIEFYGHRKRYVDFLLDAVSEFFQQDLEEIVKNEFVWKILQEKLRIRLKWILEDKEQFLKDYPLDIEDMVNEFLGQIERNAENLAKKQQKERWQFADFAEAVRTMKIWNEKGIFVALLDKEGKLLDEPYPVTVDTTINVKVKIEADSIRKQRKDIVARAKGKPFKTSHAVVTAIVLCEVPDNFAKAKVIRLE